jgi:hypothetical protein
LDEDLVAGSRRNPQQLNSIIVPLLWPNGHGIENTLVPALLARRAGQLSWLGNDDALVAEPEDSFHVATTVRSEYLTNDVYVALRHREQYLAKHCAFHAKRISRFSSKAINSRRCGGRTMEL